MRTIQYKETTNLHFQSKRDKIEELGFQFDTRYIDQYNEVCPMCQEKNMEVGTDGRLINYSSTGMTIIMQYKLAVPYAICSSCTEKLKQQDKGLSKWAKKAEEYIARLLRLH